LALSSFLPRKYGTPQLILV